MIPGLQGDKALYNIALWIGRYEALNFIRAQRVSTVQNLHGRGQKQGQVLGWITQFRTLPIDQHHAVLLHDNIARHRISVDQTQPIRRWNRLLGPVKKFIR